MIRRIATLIALVALAAIPAGASAFGTIHGYIAGNGPFHAEHEKITRAALSCDVPDPVDNCFESRSLDNMAGAKSTFGAVGAPDNYSTLGGGPDWWHCDAADAFADVFPSYPVSVDTAQAALLRCRAYVRLEMTTGTTGTEFASRGTPNGAVGGAKYLLDSQDRVNADDLSWVSCTFVLVPGRAKCNELESFGRAIHAVQDFYSHSNWADLPTPNAVLSLTNPPGLGETAPSGFWNLDFDSTTVPVGLGTGCYPSKQCPNRVTHDEGLNKDKVQIDWRQGAKAPIACAPDDRPSFCTPRGLVLHNEQSAVTDAILDTRRQWAWLQQQLLATYGAAKGAAMICAIHRDDINTVCNQMPGMSGDTVARMDPPPRVPPLKAVSGPVRGCRNVNTALGAIAIRIRAQGTTCTEARKLVRRVETALTSQRSHAIGGYTTVVSSGPLKGLRKTIMVSATSATDSSAGVIRLRWNAIKVTFSPHCVLAAHGGTSTCGF